MNKVNITFEVERWQFLNEVVKAAVRIQKEYPDAVVRVRVHR